MTKREMAVFTAYTGFLFGRFEWFHEYAEELMGRGIYTHEFADQDLADEISRRSKEEFMQINHEAIAKVDQDAEQPNR